MANVYHATAATIAESLGISHVKESGYAELAYGAQNYLLSIIADSLTIMTACKRSILSFSDINSALELNHFRPLFGFSSAEPPRLQRAGVVSALELFFSEDKQIPVEHFNRFEPRPYPLTPHFDFEWLCVVGRCRSELQAREEPEFPEAPDLAKIRSGLPRQRRDLDLEVTSSKHIFSYELQVFFRTLRGKLVSDDLEAREMMLRHLQRDSCLQALLPYCMRFAKLLIRDNPRLLQPLYVAVHVPRAIITNVGFKYLDAYLLDMLMIALTMLMSSAALPKNVYEQHVVQEYAADLLALILNRAMKRMYVTVQPMVTSQLMSLVVTPAFQSTEKLGAVLALRYLGLETVVNYLLPALGALVDEAVGQVVEAEIDRHNAGVELYWECVRTAGMALHADTFKTAALGFFAGMASSKATYGTMVQKMGADLLPYVIDDSALLYL
jgi:hypothetical protein